MKKTESFVNGVILRNGIYFLDYRYSGRRKRKKVGPDKTLAELAMAKIRTQMAENKYLDIKKENNIKFVDFAEEYLNLHAKRFVKSFNISGRNNVMQLVRHFGGKCLHEITVKDVDEFKTRRLAEVTPATVNRQLACLKSMFNRAIEWERFDGKNPVCKVKMLKENNERCEYLEVDEMRRFIAACPDYFRPIAIVALNTGMRRSEILGLKWKDVNFTNSTIYIRQAKSGEGRTVRMGRVVSDALIAVRKNPKSEYIFTKKDGTRRFDLRKPFTKALENAGIDRPFRFHDLRHTCASHLAMRGYDIYGIKEYLGHKSLEMTMRYSHLSPTHQQKMASTFDEILGVKRPQVETENISIGQELQIV